MKKHMLILLSALLFVFGLGQLNLTSSSSTQIFNQSRAHFLRHGASTNWSGYAIETNLTTPQSDVVSNVSGQWVIPTVTCSNRGNTYSSVWVGVDGYSNSTVEQTGTEQDCSRGRPQYYAWYEMYPQASHAISLAVAPGNVMAASVQYTSGASYTLTLQDVSTGKSFSIARQLSGTGRQSAEWVVEAPSSYFGVLPLANFGKASLTSASATINGHVGTISDTTWQNDPITMVTNSGVPKATPSALSADGSSFSVVWSHN